MGSHGKYAIYLSLGKVGMSSGFSLCPIELKVNFSRLQSPQLELSGNILFRFLIIMCTSIR